MPITIRTITPFPDPPPTRLDRANFRARADSKVAHDVVIVNEINNDFIPDVENAAEFCETQAELAEQSKTEAISEVTILKDQAIAAKNDAVDAKDAALSSANFLGYWINLSGAYSSGSVKHLNKIWLLDGAVANIETHEPGTSAVWVDISSLPNQSGNSGKFLTTDGEFAAWEDIDAFPEQSGQQGKFLATNGSNTSWEEVDALPNQSGQQGRFLTTNGSAASWININQYNITLSSAAPSGGVNGDIWMRF